MFLKNKSNNTIRWGLRQKLTAAIAVVMLFAVIAVSGINHIRYTEYFSRQTSLQTGQLLEQAGINVDTYLEELFRLTLAPYYNDDVMRMLASRPDDDAGLLEKSRRIEAFLGSVMTIPRTDITRVYIFTDDGIYSSEKTVYGISREFDYTQADWYKKTLNSDGPVFLPVRSEKIFGKGETQLFSVAQKLRSKSDNTRVLGVIRVDANYRGIQSICDKVRLQSGGGLYISDSAGNLIYSNGVLDPQTRDLLLDLIHENSWINGTTVNGTPFLLNSYPLKSVNWMLVAVNDYDEINRYAANTRNAALAVAFICAFASVILLFAALNRFLRPMRQVVALMERVERGDTGVRFDGKNNDEIGYLGDSFNRMLDELERSILQNNQLLRKVYEAQYLEKEAQYDLLCSQIRPHFLYNALNTISLLVKCGESSDAVTAAEKLSIYLRGVMSGSRDIPLHSELKIIDAYLSFQQIRYRTKLKYEIDVGERFLYYKLPALSLQPLVENAVIHGCEEVSAAVYIRVYTVCEQDSWLLCVEDDAGGMDADVLAKLCERIAGLDDESDENRFARNIGIINVQKRIRLKYGSAYGLSVESELGSGTRVMIRIPYDEKEEEHVQGPDC